MNTAMSLVPNGANIKACETDFVFLTTRGRDHRIQLAIGECKTRLSVNEGDVQGLLRVARAFPADRFTVFLIFAKLAEFNDEELELISSANDRHVRRVIILTDRELEPWRPYERAALEYDINPTVVDFEGMANATHKVFFEKKRRNPLL